jgi:hypothetical protein
MEEVRAYENFPLRLVCISVLVNVSIYALGAYILSGYDPLIAALYLLYCIGNEIHVMKMSCVDCYYYGKWCALGRGKVAPFLFKRGDPGRFTAKIISWKELLPDMLVLMLPLVGGAALLIQGFSWSMALILTFLPALSLGGNYFVRSQIACKYCQQRELGCPAEQFFSKQ